MGGDLALMAGLAAGIGFLHTLLGPDHYVPFIVLARARGWSAPKTAAITVLCGVGHVLSSAVLGLVGIAVGLGVGGLSAVESIRGYVAGWLLFSFGIVYLVWGVHRAIRNRPHRHVHVHGDGDAHEHEHGHAADHSHVHGSGSANVTAWVLFTIFVFGPCEPLIPILMYPAAAGGSWLQVAAVAAIFSVVTIATMTAVVMGAQLGLSLVPLRKFERYTHALAGTAITSAGAAVLVLGL